MDSNNINSIFSSSNSSSIICCNNNDVSEFYKCKVHSRCLEFLCKNCNVLLCANCSISACHRGHIIEDFDMVVQDLHTNGHLQQRLDDLWCKTKVYDKMIAKFKQNEEEVTEYYRELHEFLMIEEHKIKKPLRNEREQAENKIQSILQEIKEINNLIATVSCYNKKYNKDNSKDKDNNKDRDKDEMIISENNSPSTICSKRKYKEMCQENNNSNNNSNGSEDIDYQDESKQDQFEPFESEDNINFCIEKVMESIKELGSVSELIQKNKTMFQINQQCDKPIELLHLVQKYMALMKCNGEANPPLPYELRLVNFEKVKQYLTRIYELTDEDPGHDRANYFFTTGADGSFIFDITSSKWSKICDDFEKRTLPLYSVISDGSYIYVFGGASNSVTYSRLCIESMSWDKHSKITTGEGGYGISTCYDGERYIYLVGGNYNKISLKRIDVFDTQTQTFKRIGNIPQCGRVGSYSFYFQGLVYIVGGIRERTDWPSILTFDPVQSKFSTLIDDIGFIDFIISACFDGQDLIYILDKNKNFFTISLSTKQKKTLDSPNITGCTTGTCSMIYLNTCNINNENNNLLYGEVYFIGGKQSGNHVYCVGSNSWHPVHDFDQYNRVSNGTTKFLKNKPKTN